MRIITTLILSLLCSIAFAQSGGTSSKKAQKLYDEAREDMKWGRLEMAELRVEQALEKDPNYLDAMMIMSEITMRNNDLEGSKMWTKKIIDSDPTFAPNLLLIIATLEQYDGEYETALGYFEQYLTIAPKESGNYRAAKLGAASCEYSMWAMAHPVDYDIKNLGESINTEHDEYFPSMTADEHTLMFTRALPVERASYFEGDRNEDFFFAERNVEGEWNMAENPGSPLNTPFNEGAPNLSADGLYLFYTACDLDQMGNYGGGKKGFGRCDLFVCVRQGNKWSKPHNMGKTINTNNWESQPSFSSDGKTIYFIRRRQPRGREPQTDIYYSELRNGLWTKAQPMPMNINTSGNEESVFIHPDNQTLYFSSDGHVGLGNMDIYVSRRQDDGTWGDPKNLGYPINTHEHENSFYVAPTGTYAIIGSDREGGYGGMDLYRLELPEEAQPKRIAYLKGTVRDAKTNAPLGASFQLINMTNSDTIAESISDGKTGEFLVVLPSNQEFALYAQHEGYLFHSENFTLDLSSEKTHYEKEILLQPFEAGNSVVLKNVFFDTDKFTLKPKSQAELKKLVRLLDENPSLNIEIAGHTDNQGNPQANVTLSSNRAQAVYEFLIRAGISADRLSHQGYGESKPIASNDTEEGRQQNRRTEFKVVE